MPVAADQTPGLAGVPTKLSAEAGERIEPPVSEPVPAVAKFEATAVAVPPEDPPVFLVRSYGFFTCPPSELTEMPPLAKFLQVGLAKNDCTGISEPFDGESVLFRLCTLQMREPAVVGMSAVSKLSFRTMGCSRAALICGCAESPDQKASACLRLAGLMYSMELTAGPCWS